MRDAIERRERVKSINAIMRAAFWLALAAPCLGILIESFKFCAVVLALAALLGLWGIGNRLLRDLQIGLLEALFVVALLGNAVGWAGSHSFEEHGRAWSLKTLAVFAFLAVTAVIWVLGALSNGLWMARRLGYAKTPQRLLLILLYLLVPLAIVALPIAFFGGLLGALEMASIGVFGLLAFGCVLVLRAAWRLRARAR